MNQPSDKINGTTETSGQILKRAREDKQISIQEVAQRLLLGKHIIVALEEDNYSKIPAQVYAEGYLKAYAQLLQIPVDSVLQDFRKLSVYAKQPAQTNEQRSVEDKSQKPCVLTKLYQFSTAPHTKLLALIAIAVIIIAVLVAFFGKQLSSKHVDTLTVPSVTPATINSEEGNKTIPITSESQQPATAPANAVPLEPEKKSEAPVTSPQQTLPADKPKVESIPLQLTPKKETTAKENKPKDEPQIIIKKDQTTPSENQHLAEPKLILTPPKTITQ